MNISTRVKKIIFISLLVIVTGLIAFGIYYVFFRPIIAPTNNGNANVNGITNGRLPNANTNRPTNQTPVANENVNGTVLPSISDIAEGGVTKVTSVADVDALYGAPTTDRAGFVYYDSNENKFKQILPNGEILDYSSQEFYNVQDVTWSDDRNQAIINYPDGSNLYYNFQTNQSVTLPKEIEEVEFTDEGDKIAYEFIGDNERQRWLAVANPDGSGQQIIESIGDRQDRVDVNWSPDDQVVATYREGTGLETEEIYFLGQYGENFKSIEVNGAGFTGRWSPQGDKIVYSVYNSDTGYKPNLWIVDGRGDSLGLNNTNLNLQTWPDKCAFGGSSLYCAVPTDLPEGAGMAPEYTRLTHDIFYEVDLNTGQRTLLAIPQSASGSNDYAAEDVYLSLDGSILYFRNAYTGKLEKIMLK